MHGKYVRWYVFLLLEMPVTYVTYVTVNNTKNVKLECKNLLLLELLSYFDNFSFKSNMRTKLQDVKQD